MQFTISNILLITVVISIISVIYWYVRMSKKLIEWSRIQKKEKQESQQKFEEVKDFQESVLTNSKNIYPKKRILKNSSSTQTLKPQNSQKNSQTPKIQL